MGGILAYRDLSAQAPKLPGRRRASLLRQRIRRCEAHQELPGERAAGPPAEHVVAPARVRSLEVQPGAHDAAPGPVDELHFAAADGLHDADVGKAPPVGVAEEHQVAGARPAPQGPPRLRKAVQIRDPVLSRPWRKTAQADAFPRIDGAHEARAVVGRAARELAHRAEAGGCLRLPGEPRPEHRSEEEEEHAGKKLLTRRKVWNPRQLARPPAGQAGGYLRSTLPRE